MNLYPLKFTPILKEKLWGGNKLKSVLNKDLGNLPNAGESWEISGVQDDISVVSNGFLAGNDLEELVEIYMGDLVGDHVFDQFGVEFPLLIKFIDAKGKLSIQVHPDDDLSKERHNAYGKSEMWYIIEAEKNAELIIGFNQEIDKNIFTNALNHGTITDLLNYESIEAGHCFYNPAGRIHAICEGTLLAEIQQTSDITYRIHDWNRKDLEGNSRELHTDLAIDAIDYSYEKKYRTDYETKLNETKELVRCPYFTSNILEFDQAIQMDYHELDSFVVYMCLEGNFSIDHGEDEKTIVQKGESVLVPAILDTFKLIPDGKTKILEVYIR